MTYCLGIVTKHGLVMASDSRTNSGTDQVSVCRKMFWFEKPGERVFVILTSGGLSLSQSVLTFPSVIHSRTSFAVIGVSSTPLRKCPVAITRPCRSVGPRTGK